MEKGTSYEGRSANRTASSDADGATSAAQIEEENSDSDANDATSAAQMEEEENSDNDADGATSAAQMEEDSDNDGHNNNSGTDGHYDRWSDDDDEEYGHRSDDDADAAHEEDSSDDDDDSDYDISGPDGEDDEIFYDNEVFNVMGSVKEKRYQDALDRVQELMAKDENVPVRVERDPDNIQDKNALIVEAFVNESWKNVGTIQKRKIPKLTRALRQGTAGSYRFAGSPQYKLNVYKSGLNGLTCQLIITNKGRWDDDDRTYYYYKDLSHL